MGGIWRIVFAFPTEPAGLNIAPPPGIGSLTYPEGIFGSCGGLTGGINFCGGLGGFFTGQHTFGDFGGTFHCTRHKTIPSILFKFLILFFADCEHGLSPNIAYKFAAFPSPAWEPAQKERDAYLTWLGSCRLIGLT